MAFNMNRLYDRQYGAASGSDYFGGGGPSVNASINANIGVGTGDARWTGIVVIALLALALVGYHGLKL